MSPRVRLLAQPEEDHVAVTPLELFFDLVFVFAITQVTASIAAQPDGRGVLRGVLLVALLWWSWVGYAWLANTVRPDEGLVRLGVFAAMGAMLVIALAIPEAFEDRAGGLSGPVVVAVAYFAFRALHLLIYAAAARDDPGLRRQLWRFTPSLVGGTALLLVASQTSGDLQTLLWALALLADYGGTLLAGSAGWRIRSPGHFAERHGLIVIVALGESIAAIGVGAGGLPISWAVLVASLLGLTVAAALWWTYFDVVALVAERVLTRAAPDQRVRLARDSYSYLHLPMVTGIVLCAFGLKKVLATVADAGAPGAGHHAMTDPLDLVPVAAMYGGVALYLAGQVLFRLRNLHTLNVQRTVVTAGLLALVPVAALLPALAALGLLAAVTTGLIAYEAARFGDARDRVRHLGEVAVSTRR